MKLLPENLEVASIWTVYWVKDDQYKGDILFPKINQKLAYLSSQELCAPIADVLARFIQFHETIS